MKTFKWLLCLVIFSAGCATYNFKRGDKPYDSGYVVSRGKQVIVEYTIGEDNSVPELDVAKERFKRRKSTVEQYYEKMGEIDSNFQRYFIKPGSAFMGVVSSPFKLPFVAMKNYKYDHDAAYREKVDKVESEKDVQKRQRLKELKDALANYINDDLVKFEKVSSAKELPKEEAKPVEAVAPQEAAAAVPQDPGQQEGLGQEEAGSPEAPKQLEAVSAEGLKQEETAPAEEAKQEEPAVAAEEPNQAVVAPAEEPKNEAATLPEEPKQEESVSAEAPNQEEVVATEEPKQEEIVSTEEPKPEKQEAAQPAQESAPAEEVQPAAEAATPAPQEEAAKQEEPAVKKEVRKKTIWQKVFRAKAVEEPQGELVSEQAAPVEQKPKKSLWGRMFGPKKKKEAAEAAKKEEPQGSAQTEEPQEVAQAQARETTAQEAEASVSEAKPKKSIWQKIFKKKPKEEKVETVSEEEAEEKPKEGFWKKLFKPKEKAPAITVPQPGEPPQAVIIAKPVKGYSPLKVNFYGGASRAAKGRIVSYEWDFGDGDTSEKKSAVNTFWSGSFEPKTFTVTLTVQDDKGNTNTAKTEIEVMNK